MHFQWIRNMQNWSWMTNYVKDINGANIRGNGQIIRCWATFHWIILTRLQLTKLVEKRCMSYSNYKLEAVMGKLVLIPQSEVVHLIHFSHFFVTFFTQWCISGKIKVVLKLEKKKSNWKSNSEKGWNPLISTTVSAATMTSTALYLQKGQ